MIPSKYKYWVFQKALDNDLCDIIIKLGLSKQKSKGMIGNYGLDNKKLTEDEENKLSKLRQSDVTWLNQPWLYRILQNYLEMANVNAGWNFEWSKSEEIQFTIYKQNQFYEWHADLDDNPEEDGLTRKISMSVSLSDPQDYEGGEFEFDYRNLSRSSTNIEEVTRLKPRGSILVFPSYIFHRVKPILKGTRYSLVMWTRGKIWK